VRYRFAFTGENALYQTEMVGVEAALSLGVRFP
jgi:hypothetical protein